VTSRAPKTSAVSQLPIACQLRLCAGGRCNGDIRRSRSRVERTAGLAGDNDSGCNRIWFGECHGGAARRDRCGPPLLDNIAELHVAGGRSSRPGVCRSRSGGPDYALASRTALWTRWPERASGALRASHTSIIPVVPLSLTPSLRKITGTDPPSPGSFVRWPLNEVRVKAHGLCCR
jgi:hypothetical protein